MAQRDVQDELKRLKARLASARKRASYWSGRPSARGFGYRPSANNGRDPDMEYEMAMDDCHALSDQIEELTGRRPKVTDYREIAREAFLARMAELFSLNN